MHEQTKAAAAAAALHDVSATSRQFVPPWSFARKRRRGESADQIIAKCAELIGHNVSSALREEIQIVSLTVLKIKPDQRGAAGQKKS